MPLIPTLHNRDHRYIGTRSEISSSHYLRSIDTVSRSIARKYSSVIRSRFRNRRPLQLGNAEVRLCRARARGYSRNEKKKKKKEERIEPLDYVVTVSK